MNDNDGGASPDELQRIILSACNAAHEIMKRRGIPAEEIANGFIAYGGAIALEMVGTEDTAHLFQSKADALRESVH